MLARFHLSALLVGLPLAACGPNDIAPGRSIGLAGGPDFCLGGPEGIDVSEFNGEVDWGAVADSGVDFAFAKATEGLTLRDGRFAANWAGMRASGVLRGAYHYFHAGDDGAAQADAFLAGVGSLEPEDLPPVLDWETSDGSTPAEAVAAALAFVAEVEKRTGQTTILYTYRDYWDSLGDPPELAESPLWLASDASTCPATPSPWSSWLFWQYAADGEVGGVPTPVDRDRFAGSLEELRSLARAEGSQTASPAPMTQARMGCGGGPSCAWPVCALVAARARRRPRRRRRRRAAAATPS